MWNGFSVISCCENLLDLVLAHVNPVITELTQLERHSVPRRRYFYDDFCLAMLIKGVCLRHKRNVVDALACLQFIVTQ